MTDATAPQSLPPHLEAAVASLRPAIREHVRQRLLADPARHVATRFVPRSVAEPRREGIKRTVAPRRRAAKVAANQRARRVPCIHEGPIVSWCPLGNESLHERRCLHDDGPDICRRASECQTCRLYSLTRPIVSLTADRRMPPDPDGWNRHLLYFVYPVAGNSIWQCNVDQLIERLPLFTGRRIVAIATAAGLVTPRVGGRNDRTGGRPPHRVDPPEAVQERLAGHGCEFIVQPNNGQTGEVAAFPLLMERVADARAPGDVTFYGHSKGVTRPVNPGVSVHPWASLLYAANLDYWPVVAELLARHPIVGAMKTVGKTAAYPGGVHYSGTFFWFRNADVFARNWGNVPQIWGGVEAWPGAMFDAAEAGCVFWEEPTRRRVTGYDFPRLRLAMSQFAAWSESNAAIRRPGASPRPWLDRHGYE